ncbi:MAG: exo-alpha-sialidase [Candidatus Latescibacteria bacterium]|nr:exo-alpha-sialidase [Candidatus Latescibacterota bacterium]
MSKLTKIRDMVIYLDDRYYCGPGPSAVQFPDGRIAVAFRRAYNWATEGIHAHGFPSTEACLITTEDNGRTWWPPRVFYSGNITNQNLTMLPDGTLICLSHRGELIPHKVYERLKDTRRFYHDPHFGWIYASHGIQVMRSLDTGQTWEGPYYVSPVPGTEPILPGWPSPAGLRASAIALNDGSVGVAVYGLIGTNPNASNVWFMTSADRGATWEPRGRIANDPEGINYYNETAVYQGEDGKLIAFMRVEQDRDDRLHTSVSYNAGKTWSSPKRERLKGHPYQAVRLPSGNVLLVYGYRHEPRGIRACLLEPECDNIDDADEVILRDDGGSFDLGYPHALTLRDGTVLVTYYYNIGDGVRHIAGTIIEEK